ncbi:MAG: Succinate-semialdehyde dehydrogenase [Fibrobacteres bacterium]|nr:Succinate-semialdehyde dehydrogenase [Fibrobacterota bacterium]
MALVSINPADGRVLAEYPEMEDAAIRQAIEEGHRAFLEWRRTDFAHRADLMRKAAAILRGEAAHFASLMAYEMGKPVRDGRAEAGKCAAGCEYYAEHARAFLAPEPVATEARSSFVAFNPLGVVLAVMPWNFPFWQVFRFAAPALMAGNAGLLKHAGNVQGCAAAIEDVFLRAGFPPGLFRNLPVTGSRVGRILEDARVRAVTLTGSVEAGRSIAAKAGSLLKKSVMELGGSDAYLILEDADLESAAAICAKSRLINSGQSCIAAKRFLVVEPVRARFEKLFTEAMAAFTTGDPAREETMLGPLARRDLRDELQRQVDGSIAKGARPLCGGRIPEGPGAFYPPTVLTDVKPGMPAYEEELFGPVAAVIPVRDEADAVRVANDSRFGLGAAVFTRDPARGERIASAELEAGNCFVNALVQSDPRLPFGGVKDSGYGRELSAYGIREFVNIKTVYAA